MIFEHIFDWLEKDSSFFAYILLGMWNSRNAAVFEMVPCNPHAIMIQAERTQKESFWSESHRVHNPLDTSAEHEVRNELPNTSATSKGKGKVLLIL